MREEHLAVETAAISSASLLGRSNRNERLPLPRRPHCDLLLNSTGDTNRIRGRQIIIMMGQHHHHRLDDLSIILIDTIFIQTRNWSKISNLFNKKSGQRLEK